MIAEAYVPLLRQALTRAGFTVDAAYALLGAEAHQALGRNQVVPALRASSGSGDLATLVRLFARPESIVLRLQQGIRRARQVDTVEAGLVSASDGDLTAGQILGALAVLLDREEAELRRTYVSSVRELVAEGFLS